MLTRADGGSFWWEGRQGEQSSLMGGLDGRLVHEKGGQVGLTAGERAGRGRCRWRLVQRDGAPVVDLNFW